MRVHGVGALHRVSAARKMILEAFGWMAKFIVGSK